MKDGKTNRNSSSLSVCRISLPSEILCSEAQRKIFSVNKLWLWLMYDKDLNPNPNPNPILLLLLLLPISLFKSHRQKEQQ